MAIFKRISILFLRISISVIVLIFLFKLVNREALFTVLKKADLPLVLCGFFVSLSSYYICFLRWKMLLNAIGIDLPPGRLITPFTGGIFFNMFLPSTIGGDFVRSADLAFHTKKTDEVVASVILDRLSGYIGLVAIAAVGVLFGWDLIRNKVILFCVLGLVFILVVILLIIFNSFTYSLINRILHSPKSGKIRASLENIHKELFYFRKHKKTALKNILLSLLIQAVSPVSAYIVALAFGIKLNIAYFFMLIPIISAVSLLPVSIGGLGVRDAATIFFYAKIGISKDLAFAMSLLGFFFIAVLAGIGGLIYVFALYHRRI